MKLEVFDPAMCCSTGVCGPSVDPDLARFAGDLEWLASQGVDVSRYNLSSEPQAFADSEQAKTALAERGDDGFFQRLGGDCIGFGCHRGVAVVVRLAHARAMVLVRRTFCCSWMIP